MAVIILHYNLDMLILNNIGDLVSGITVCLHTSVSDQKSSLNKSTKLRRYIFNPGLILWRPFSEVFSVRSNLYILSAHACVAWFSWTLSRRCSGGGNNVRDVDSICIADSVYIAYIVRAICIA